MTPKPKSLTGVIRLPDAQLHFYLSFDDKGPKAGVAGLEAKMIGRILEKAVELSPDLRDILIDFAEHLEKTTDGDSGQSPE